MSSDSPTRVPAPKETWFCADCGSEDIRHDAIVQWDPDKEDWEVIVVLDGTWCEECQEKGNHSGSPVFGVPGP